MLAILITSLLGGFFFATTSVWMGSGFWAVMMWYVVGCWVGFLLPLAMVLLRQRDVIGLPSPRERAVQR